MLEIVIWILGVSAFTFLGSWYVRRFGRSDALIGLYIAFMVFSSIAATKTASFDLGVARFYAPAGVLIYAVTYLFTDIVNERFGVRETQVMIAISFASQVAVAFLTWLIIALPAAPFYMGQDSLQSILGQVPRITAASWVSFLICENVDALIFGWFKARTKRRHLWARNVFSSTPALALDSVIFVTLAFYGVLPIVPLIVGQIVTKWLVALLDIPFMYLNRWIMYRSV
jgi:hypothetical protein